MPVDGDRSMVTVDPGVRASAADVAALEPRAVALSLDQLYCVPEGSAAYVTCGDDDARAFARRPPAQLAGARALFVSKREALTLTEASGVDAAAETLGRSAERVIVTLGSEGAMALVEGKSMRAPAISATALDTTGAGDLLVAAYIWADLRGASPEECLQWAVIYAGLSIATPTGVGGAVSEARLLEEGAQRGLTAPRSATT
jgi:ribokinase